MKLGYSDRKRSKELRMKLGRKRQNFKRKTWTNQKDVRVWVKVGNGPQMKIDGKHQNETYWEWSKTRQRHWNKAEDFWREILSKVRESRS